MPIGNVLDRVVNGFRSGGKAVVESYTGSSKEENIAGKAASGAVGGIAGAATGKAAAKAAVEQATTRVERAAAEKAVGKIVVKAAAKGALKAVGWIGLIPDAITFGKGFAKGYSSYGN